MLESKESRKEKKKGGEKDKDFFWELKEVKKMKDKRILSLVLILSVCVLAGCAVFRGLIVVRGFDIKKVPGVDWVYESEDINKYRSAKYLKTFVIAGADKIPEAATAEMLLSNTSVALTKARAEAGFILINQVAPGVVQAHVAIGKTKNLQECLIEMKAQLPYLSPRDVVIGFTKKGSCYYIGVLPKDAIVGVIGKVYSNKIADFVKSWIGKEFPALPRLSEAEVTPEKIEQNNGMVVD